MAIGDRDSGEIYSWNRGQKGAGTVGMVKLLRWPSGTGTAEKYIAGTVAKKGTGTVGIVKLVRWPSGTGTVEKYIDGTVAKKGTGTVGMVKLVQWPSGTGTANEYIHRYINTSLWLKIHGPSDREQANKTAD